MITMRTPLILFFALFVSMTASVVEAATATKSVANNRAMPPSVVTTYTQKIAPVTPVSNLVGHYYNIGGCQVFERDLPDDPSNAGPLYVKCPSSVTLKEVAYPTVDLTTHAAVAILPPALPMIVNSNNTWKFYNTDYPVGNAPGMPSNVTFFIETAAGLPMLGNSPVFTPVVINAITGDVIVSARVYVCKSGTPYNVNIASTPFQTTGDLFITSSSTPPQTTAMQGGACVPYTP